MWTRLVIWTFAEVRFVWNWQSELDISDFNSDLHMMTTMRHLASSMDIQQGAKAKGGTDKIPNKKLIFNILGKVKK